MKRDLCGACDPQSQVTGRVRLGAGARVVNSIIRGPAVIGEGSEIIDSFIGPYTTIGPRTRIIHSVVEHSVILNDCRIENIPRLEDSLIGRESRISHGKKQSQALRLMVGDNAVVEI